MIAFAAFSADDPARLAEFYEGLHSRFVTWGTRAEAPWQHAPLEIEILASSRKLPRRLRGRLVMLVDDMAEALEYVVRKGGSTVIPPRRVGSRTMALIRDPEGNEIGFHTWPE